MTFADYAASHPVVAAALTLWTMAGVGLGVLVWGELHGRR